ncbi:MAG TPA: hypothetical protein VGP41_08180 [Candidatus Lustribacter sp.]|nr:hypothetical protein [Candidatus Lustribacter sp.]
MRLFGLMLAACMLAVAAPAFATGTVRIQQRDGSVKTYPSVILKLDGSWSLALTSADKVSTVVLSGGNCTPAGDIVRCSGGRLSFHQDGRNHAVPFKTATFYFNLTDRQQPLSSSATKIAPNSVSFAVTTAKGTSLTGSGKLDQEPAR